MSLSIAMIVKNEERGLMRCLESIESIADELSIVDTGSTDRTIEVIKEFDRKTDFPVILNHHEWEKGFFSGNRNFGLQFCTKRWIFWIDADEWVPPEYYSEINQITKRGDIYTCFCALLSNLPDGRISKHYLPKMFRRGSAYFQGIVHNQLIHVSPSLVTGIKINHDGYALDSGVMKTKRKRTSDLLRTQLKEKEDNAFAYMNLARTLMNDQKYQESLEVSEKGLKCDSSDDCKQMLFYSLAICACQLKQYERAKNACWAALKMNPQNLDMTFVLANTCLLQKQFERAIIYLNRYIQLKEEEDQKPTNQQLNFLITDFYEARSRAYHFLGVCYNKIGQRDKALEVQRKSVQLDTNPTFLGNLALTYEQNGNLESAREVWYYMVNRGYVDDLILRKLGGR